MEQMPQIKLTPQDTTADKMTVLGNLMQVMLAQKHGERYEEFIELHAKTLREALDSHPEFLEKFEKDPSSVLKELEEIVYH